MPDGRTDGRTSKACKAATPARLTITRRDLTRPIEKYKIGLHPMR